MKKGIIVTTLVAVLVLSVSIFAFGPHWNDQAAPETRGNMMYRANEDFEPLHQDCDDIYSNGEDTTIEGTIIEVEYMPMEIEVETADGIVEVHTGPIWMYSGIEFAEGQSVVIEGKLVTVDEESFVVPSKITIDGTEIVLRTDEGFPAWMRGGMMNQAQSHGRSHGARGNFQNAPRGRGNYQNAPEQGNFRNAPARGNFGSRGSYGPGNCQR
ncbi:hypothetical protein IX53_07920 [Kosmotoga pacifica]|uniref:DUF5666 domain-containing protein n=2 Tax=Kosmotoga pacifica TaxID=1330330 RepID=A0A0G2Z817_9BACT|nr:hypothetical protein IX53_07920 [Kosmotoga pacifica]